jgi:ribosome maturation factor RimP
MTDIEVKITDWVNEAIKGSDAFIYQVKHHKSGDKIQIFLDADDGVNIYRCADVSRFVDEKLEEMMPNHPYALEVGSPGADKPLKFIRQYKKHIGRKLEVTLNDEKQVTNNLKEVKESSIVLGEKVTNLLTKRKPKPDIEIPFEDIKESIVVISFN